MSKQPAPYAPDMFSEHAKAAQFGLASSPLLRQAVADAKAAGYVWHWVHKAEMLIYNTEELVCVDAPSYMGNPQEWLSARCHHCKELVPLGQGEHYGTNRAWAHAACNLREAGKGVPS